MNELLDGWHSDGGPLLGTQQELAERSIDFATSRLQPISSTPHSILPLNAHTMGHFGIAAQLLSNPSGRMVSWSVDVAPPTVQLTN